MVDQPTGGHRLNFRPCGCPENHIEGVRPAGTKVNYADMEFLVQSSKQLDTSTRLVWRTGKLRTSTIARKKDQSAGLSLQGAKVGSIGVSPNIYIVRVANIPFNIGMEATAVGARFHFSDLENRCCRGRPEVEVEVYDIISLKG
jgi:hypothetical protein